MVNRKKQGIVTNYYSSFNYYSIFIFIILFAVSYFAYFAYYKFNTLVPNNNNNNYQNTLALIPLMNNSCKRENDVLLNPYDAPLRDERVFNNYNNVKIPINIPTQSVNSNYRQLGILTRVNRDDTILPLMGRPLIVNRDKWNYYTMNDKNNMIKLPISFKNKSCTSEIGCDSVYNGDTVYVEGYSDLFRVTLYDNASMEYIPYL
jgi:hypothetical protein